MFLKSYSLLISLDKKILHIELQRNQSAISVS